MLTRALCVVSLLSTRGYARSLCQPAVTQGLSLLLTRTVYLTAPLLGFRRVPRLAHDLLLSRLLLVEPLQQLSTCGLTSTHGLSLDTRPFVDAWSLVDTRSFINAGSISSVCVVSP